MRNVIEAPAPTLMVEAISGGSVAVFPDATFFGGFPDGGQEALYTTLSLAKEQVEEALVGTQVETINGGISEWRMAIDVEESGTVKVRRLMLAEGLARLQNWETTLLMVTSALTVLLARSVVFV